MTFFFETYGCQMNSAESSAVDLLLTGRGWTRSDSVETADLILVNTCSVRITAETRVFGRLSLFSAWKRKRSFTVLVMGCMAERLHEELKTRFSGVDYVVGMFERDQFTAIFDEIELRHSGVSTSPAIAQSSTESETPVHAGSYYFAPASWQEGSFQSYVPIMNGCNNFCTYCIVPYVRGREISRSPAAILAELDTLSGKGVREITLLGQNVNSWAYTVPEGELPVPEMALLKADRRVPGTVLTFPDLLFLVARRVEKTARIGWVRFMSSHPKDLSDALIEVVATEKALCKLIHLPVQHGSDRILSAMNRRYTKASYLALVSRIRERIPEVALSTDLLVGFPGETESDIDETLELMRQVGWAAAFMYHYNPREGTVAYDLPGRIDESVKKERLDRVIKLQHAISAEILRRRVGSEALVLIESTSRNNPEELFGHTEQGEMVVFSGKGDPALIGSFVTATLTGLRGRTFRAKIKE